VPRSKGPYASGGFGGADGLAAWLREHQVQAVVDVVIVRRPEPPRGARVLPNEAGVLSHLSELGLPGRA
jgi:hypothetical protein